MRLVVLSLVLLGALSLSGAEQSDARFEKLMGRSRKIFETNHMVVDLQLSSYDNKIPPAECHYDRYPGKKERIRLPDGGTFARKEGGKWLESEDWRESGEPVKSTRSNQLNVFAGYAVIPLKSRVKAATKVREQLSLG
jgi:hypothetical protein